MRLASEMTLLFLDRATGAVDRPGTERRGHGLHPASASRDLFLGLPGMLFLGAMGALFVAALVSGVVLYAPFMRRLAFGTLRTNRSRAGAAARPAQPARHRRAGVDAGGRADRVRSTPSPIRWSTAGAMANWRK